MANKHTIVVIISIMVIVGSVGYSSLNVVSAQGLEFSWPKQSFNFLSVLTDKTINVCNNSDLPATFSKYSFTFFYDGENLGVYSTGRGGAPAHENSQVFGKFESKDDRISALFFSYFDTETGGTDVTRIDTNKIKITTELDTTILWVVPYTITHEYGGAEFIDMINKAPSCTK